MNARERSPLPQRPEYAPENGALSAIFRGVPAESPSSGGGVLPLSYEARGQ